MAEPSIRPGRKNDCDAVGPSGQRCHFRDAGHPGPHYTYVRDDDEAVVVEEWTATPPVCECGHYVGHHYEDTRAWNMACRLCSCRRSIAWGRDPSLEVPHKQGGVS